MRATSTHDRTERGRARRWLVAPAVAVLLLSLGVALSASAQTVPADAPLLLEQVVDGEVRCTSASGACAIVNLYGPGGSPDVPPLFPGGQLSTTVQLRNASAAASTDLYVSPSACRNESLTGDAVAADLCATMTVAAVCASGGTTTFASPAQSLASFALLGPRAVGAGLAPGTSATCDFTVTYPADAPPPTQALRAVQPITWTLQAPEEAVAGTDTERGPAGEGGLAPPGWLPVTGTSLLGLTLAGLVLAAAGAVLLARPRTLRTAAAAVRRPLPPASAGSDAAPPRPRR